MTFTYRLQLTDGTLADPPTVRLAVPKMRPGDTIPIRRGETFASGRRRGWRGADADRRVGHAPNGRGLNGV